MAKFRQISLGAAVVADEPGFFVLPPVPNTLFQRDPSAWIFNGVTVNPMYWPARRREALHMLTIYRYHPMFLEAKFNFWYPHQNEDHGFNIQDFGRSSMEGGDIQPIGNGTVAIGMSERTQARMIEMVAKTLFEKGGAERVIVAVMTKDRAHMHLDTVYTLLDRDNKILDDLIEGFERYNKIDELDTYEEEELAYTKFFEETFELFKKHYRDLWW